MCKGLTSTPSLKTISAGGPCMHLFLKESLITSSNSSIMDFSMAENLANCDCCGKMSCEIFLDSLEFLSSFGEMSGFFLSVSLGLAFFNVSMSAFLFSTFSNGMFVALCNCCLPEEFRGGKAVL